MRHDLQIIGGMCLLFLAGCGGDRDGLPSFHDCSTTYTFGWDQKDLQLKHAEPRRCPVIISGSYDNVSTGGDIYDYGNWDASRVNLYVLDSNQTLMTSTRNVFIQVSGANYAVTSVGTGYSAATKGWEDYAKFNVIMHDESTASATMTIRYERAGTQADKKPGG